MAELTNPHQAQDVGSLIIQAGANLVCSLENATWTASKANSDVRGLCRPGALNQRTSRTGTLAVKAFGNSTSGFVNTDVDLTALTLGGQTVVPQLYTLTIGGTFDKAALPAIGVSGTAMGVTGQNYNGSVEVQIDDTDIVQALIIASEGDDNAAAQVNLSLVLNGVTIAFPVQLDGNTHAFNQGQYQRITLPFVSQAPARGTAFPTSPSGSLPGSPGLLDYALLSPRTNLSFDFISKLTHGVRRQGFLTWDGFSITVADGAITDFSYNWSTYGNWTPSLYNGT